MSQNWLWARDQMTSARNKARGKPLAKNKSTYLMVSGVSPTQDWKSDECVYALKLWGTEIIRYYPSGLIGVSMNGWSTVTTKKRIRDFGGPLSLYTDRYQVLCFGHGRCWLGCEDTWFYSNGEEMVYKDGLGLPGLVNCRQPKPIPQRRDTLSDPKIGDAFSEGTRHWICAAQRQWPHTPRLFGYLGDHPEDRSQVVTDSGVESRDLLGGMELLAMAHSGGLEPIERFLWKAPQ